MFPVLERVKEEVGDRENRARAKKKKEEQLGEGRNELKASQNVIFCFMMVQK